MPRTPAIIGLYRIVPHARVALRPTTTKPHRWRGVQPGRRDQQGEAEATTKDTAPDGTAAAEEEKGYHKNPTDIGMRAGVGLDKLTEQVGISLAVTWSHKRRCPGQCARRPALGAEILIGRLKGTGPGVGTGVTRKAPREGG